MGNYQFALGNANKAIALYKLAISKNTKNSVAYLNYAIILVKDGNPKEALLYLEKARKFNGAKNVITAKGIALTIGTCYWVMGEIDKAIGELENLKAKYEYVNHHVLTTLGYLYIVKGDLEKALQYTNEAIEDTPNSGSAFDNLGQIFLLKGEQDKAREAFLKAVEFNKDLVDSYYYLGIIAEEQSNKQEAKSYFEKAAACSITSLNTVTKEQILEKLA